MTTTESSSGSATALESKPRPWGFLLIQGIVLVLIGAILLWAPAKTKVDTYQILVALLGLYWIVSGVLDLVHMFTDHSGWGWKLFMGLLSMMAGIVVEYGIILVHFANERVEQGQPIVDAVKEAARVRLRPILMTSMTIILAMLPAAFGAGAGADANAPMAVAVIGGMISSTLLSLVVVPAVYSLVEGALERRSQ